jgi:hypothetical protein
MVRSHQKASPDATDTEEMMHRIDTGVLSC